MINVVKYINNYKINLLFIFIIITFSCKNKNDYKVNFQENKSEYNSLLKYLEKNYLRNQKYRNEVRIILLNCDEYEKTMKVEKCDKKLNNLMSELGIRSINLEKESSSCNSSVFFDKIYVMLGKKEYYPAVYYLYDYCINESLVMEKQNQEESKSEKVSYSYLSGKWYLIVDKNYP